MDLGQWLFRTFAKSNSETNPEAQRDLDLEAFRQQRLSDMLREIERFVIDNFVGRGLSSISENHA